MNKIIDIILNIKSNYNIKKYINYEWLNILENILNTEILISKSTKKLKINMSIIDLLKKKYKIDDIDELDQHVIKKRSNLNKQINCDKIYESILDDENKVDILKKIYGNDFIPLRVIEWIESKADKYIQVKFANITINIIDNEITDPDLINHIINIIRWLFEINSTPNKILNIYLFLSPEKKITYDYCIKPSKFTIHETCNLSRTNINSGASLYDTWIQIFRKEEVLKVLIHELVHYLELDINSYSHIIDKKCSHINIHSESNNILVNEAYAELLAIYLHTIYVTRIKFSSNFEDKFWELYMLEEKYTIYQINKIFKNYSIPNLNYFRKPNNFIQYTNVISYFILKYLFLINTKYFIITHKSKKNTVKLILYLLDKFYKLKITPINNIIDNSLRMSINEI
jgi:hypothetical protein